MFPESVPMLFRSFKTDRLRGTLPMVSHRDHLLPSAPYRNTHLPPRYDTNPTRCTVCSTRRTNLPGCRLPPLWRQPSVALGSLLPISLALPFSTSSESTEKDADKEPVSAAGHLMFSSSAATHIPGATMIIHLVSQFKLSTNVLRKWQPF